MSPISVEDATSTAPELSQQPGPNPPGSWGDCRPTLGLLTGRPTRVAEVDLALTSFLDRIGDRPVTVAVYSEFGRRVAPNGSDGTDHGRAGTVLLAGNVRAGHHGDPPPLDKLDDGDLATTVNFGAVFGGLLEGVLGIEAADIFGAGVKPLQIV